MKKFKINLLMVAILLLSFMVLLTACGGKLHAHSWAKDWSSDDQYHWHKCSDCSEVMDKAAHKYKDGVCICGKTEGTGGGNTPDEELKPTEGLAYVLSEDGSFAICNGYSEGGQSVSNVLIAKEFDGVPVKEIGDSAFLGNDAIVKLIMPDSIERLGHYSLQKCVNLKEITFSKNLKSIGKGAFSKSGIENITIPTTIESMGDFVFWACPNLTKAQLNCQIADLPTSTFLECKVLEEVTLSQGLITISKQAFKNCAKLKSIDIPDGVESIGEDAFYKCTNLEEVTLPQGLKSIFKQAFRECTKLKSIDIPDGVESIGESAFAKSGLDEIVIPSTVTTLEYYIFWDLPNLHTATINCEEVTAKLFYKCPKLKNIYFGEKTKIIRSWAFYNCHSINELVFDGNIEIIESSALKCEGEKANLYSLTIGINVTQFDYTYASLGYRLVEVCNESGLTAENCKGIKEIEANCLNYTTNRQDKGIFTNSNDFVFYTYNNDGAQKSLLLGYTGGSHDLILPSPETVVVNGKNLAQYSVANFAFDQKISYVDNAYKKIVIPSGVTEIGAYAFRGMEKLEELDLGSVEHIKKFAFESCGISKLTIPESLKSVTIAAFQNCLNMQTIEWNAINCRDLDYMTEINVIPGRVFAKTSAVVQKLTFGDKVQRIPAYMFEHFGNLSGEIVIPASVNYIGKYTFGYVNSWENSDTIKEKRAWFNFENQSGWTITTSKDETLTPNFSDEIKILYYLTYPYLGSTWERV